MLKRVFTGTVSAFGLLVTAGSAFAAQHGTLTYIAASKSVPTLSGAMLVALGIFMAGAAYFVMNKKKGTHSAFVAVLALGAALSVGSGISVIDSVQAEDGSNHVNLDNRNGGTVNVTGGEQNLYENVSGVPLVIQAVVLPDEASCPVDRIEVLSDNPECVDGLRLETNGFCEIDCIVHDLG